MFTPSFSEDFRIETVNSRQKQTTIMVFFINCKINIMIDMQYKFLLFQSDLILAKKKPKQNGNSIIYSTLFKLKYVLFIFIQKDIDDAVSVWNTHRIRPTRNGGPSGKPCILYCLPELEGTKDYSTQVDPDILGICRNRCLFNQNNPGDTDMLHLFKLLMEENELSSPGNVDEACDLYQTLRHLANYEIYNLQKAQQSLTFFF